MPNSSNTTKSASPSLEESLFNLRKAWGGGIPAEDEMLDSILSQIWPTPEGREALKQIFLSRPSTTNSGRSPAGEQKAKLIEKALDIVLPSLVSDLTLEREAFASGGTSSPQELLKSIRRNRDFLIFCREGLSRMGYADFKEFNDEIGFSDFVLSIGMPPSAEFISGMRANSRIASFLNNAGANENTISWAGEYLQSCIGKIPGQEAKAEAIARIAYVSRSAKYKNKVHPLARGVAWKRATESASKENALFHSMVQVKIRSLCAKEAKKDKEMGRSADDFRAEVESILSPKGEPRVSLEETILYEPTTWARKIESGEPINAEEIPFGFFDGKPAHLIANAALVIANSNAPTTESRIARGEIVAKILLPIGADSFYVRKGAEDRLLVLKGQKRLIARIRTVLEKQEIEEEIREYANAYKADPQHSGIAERLIAFYGASQDTQEESHANEKLSGEIAGTVHSFPEGDAPEPASGRGQAKTQDAPAPQVKKTRMAQEIPKPEKALENRQTLQLLEWVSSGNQPYQARVECFQRLSKSVSQGEETSLLQDVAFAIAGIALSKDRNIAETAASALLSLSYVSGYGRSAFDYSFIISNIAELSPEVSNTPLAEKIMHGTDAEAETAILSLALRAGKAGSIKDELGRVLPPRVLAAREIVDSFEPPLAAAAIIKLAKRHFPESLLLDSLEDLHFLDQESVNSVVFRSIEANRVRREGAIFSTPEANPEDSSTFEANISEKFLFRLGGSLENRNESIAKGAFLLGGPDAHRFFIQKLADASTQEERKTWADALTGIPDAMVDAAIMKHYAALPPLSQPVALETLVSRKPSMEKTEFLFEVCNSGDEKTSSIAASALAKAEFNGANAEGEFELLFRMRQSQNKLVQGHALELLPVFLKENNDAFTQDSLDNLLNLFIDDSSKEISEEAREVLLSRPHQLLAQMGVGDTMEEKTEAIYSNNDTIATLAIFVLAKEMASDSGAGFSPLNSRVNDAVKEVLAEKGQIAQLRLALAAYASRNPHYINSVLIPLLGAEDEVSSTVADSLVNLGEPGLEAAGRAAGRESLPPRISREMAQRISTNAMRLLFETGEYSRIAPLLAHSENGVRASAYSFLESAEPGKGRDDALLKALDSDSPRLKAAALSLLPREKNHFGAAFKEVTNASEEVSSFAADFAASLLEPEEALVLFADESFPEFIRQKIAEAYSSHNPGFSGELAALAFAGEEILSGHKKNAILAIRFFQDMDSLYALYRISRNAEPELQKLAEDSAVYFCEELSEAVAERAPTAQEEVPLLLEAYNLFEDARIKDAARSVARSINSKLLLEAALRSEDPEALFSSTEIFLSVSNVEYAARAALKFRELSADSMHTGSPEPFKEILFGRRDEELENLISPVRAPSADPLPYRLVKEVAIQEFINGKGAPGSDSLLFAFVEQFGDFEGIFDYGLVSVSELAWAARNEKNPKQISARLSSMSPAEIEERARLLLRVVMENDYSALYEIQKDDELSQLVCEHALRRLAEGIDFVSTASGDRLKTAESKMLLAAELLERGILPEEKTKEMVSGTSSALSVLSGRKTLYPSDLETGIAIFEKIRSDIRSVAAISAGLLKKRRQAARAEQEVSPAQAMADAAKLERAARPIQPARPSHVPRKTPRGSNSGQ